MLNIRQIPRVLHPGSRHAPPSTRAVPATQHHYGVEGERVGWGRRAREVQGTQPLERSARNQRWRRGGEGGLVGHTCHYTLSRDRRPKQNLNSKYLAFAPKWIMWTTTSKSIEIFKNLYSYIYREHQFFLFSTIILGKKILYLFLIYLDRCLSDWS